MADHRDVRLRRVYDQPSADDGRRILVDRLWPRGLSKDAARIDEWMRAVAPSTELRRWYHHDADQFDEFRRRYLDELGEPERAAAWTRLSDAADQGTITLLTASKETRRSQAAVLAERLQPR